MLRVMGKKKQLISSRMRTVKEQTKLKKLQTPSQHNVGVAIDLVKKNKLQQILDEYPDHEFLKATGMDDACIGVQKETLRLIYSKEKCLECLMNDGMTDEEAEEWFEFNTRPAYVGLKTPIWRK